MALFEKAIPYILMNEGGYVDHPSDPGGATNHGISLRFLQGVPEGDINKDDSIDAKDIRGMTQDQAAVLYRRQFWNPNSYEDLRNQGLATKIFDLAVNTGAGTANRMLQQACNLANTATVIKVDGKIGPETLRVANNLDPQYLVSIVSALACRHYILLCESNSKLKIFLRGWLARASKRYE